MDRIAMRQLAFARDRLLTCPQIATGNILCVNSSNQLSTLSRGSSRRISTTQKPITLTPKHTTIKHEHCNVLKDTRRIHKWTEPTRFSLAYSRLYSTAATAIAPTPTEQRPEPPTSIQELDDSLIDDSPILSKEQRFLVNQIIHKRKSIFFTGSAGTGKSVLLRQLIKELKEVYKPGQVAVTASTGIAACNIGGCTLHSFAGIGNGSGTLDRLLTRLAEKSSSPARGRWRKVKVLIIDEISMIDGETFDKLEHIARVMKKNELPFGGIQLVITGDFFQLPPVLGEDFSVVPLSESRSSIMRTRRRGSGSTTTIIKRNLADDDDDDLESDYFNHPPPLDPDINATLCFDAQSWRSCISNTVLLTEIFRQRDPTFVNMLTEMRHGKLSEETCQSFKDLERAPNYPNDGFAPTELFALRRHVEAANNLHLEKLSGPLIAYQAMDSGPLKKYLDRACTAPSKLLIKKGAQVMLIKNLTSTLVNGSMGLVIGFQEDQTFDDTTQQWVQSRFPIIRFEEGDVIITPQEWKMELPNGDIMASRIQVPLILAWAISIHKSQGQTMARVKVDMKNIFEAGQAYVALSRATNLAGLQVLNFNKQLVTAHPRVGEFYDSLATVSDMMKLEEETESQRVKLDAKSQREKLEAKRNLQKKTTTVRRRKKVE